MNIAVLVLLVMMAVLIYRKYNHDVSDKTQARSHVFDECMSLLQKLQTSQDQANLPILQGEYAGYQVALSIVEDTLGWRKLPPLWLLIKVIANKPSLGTFDMIVRPANNEFYSPSWQWDGNLAIPSSWPQHAIIKYQQQAVDVALLSPYVPALFTDLNMKELLVTPSMVRLTYMAKQAERGEYLIMRNAVYENTPIRKNIVEALLRQAIAIRQAAENSEDSEIKAVYETVER
ncbi:MAG: hypothetical protein Q7T58_10740 [Methylotenera sp.]|nr:hypothetical protein [Methylotenera sp.]